MLIMQLSSNYLDAHLFVESITNLILLYMFYTVNMFNSIKSRTKSTCEDLGLEFEDDIQTHKHKKSSQNTINRTSVLLLSQMMRKSLRISSDYNEIPHSTVFLFLPIVINYL